MSETFNQQPQEKSSEELLKKERFENLSRLFFEAKVILADEGKEQAKEYLPKIYDGLIELNKRDKKDWQTLWDWNPNGDLSEEEFNSLNHKRKSLEDVIDINESSDVIGNDSNKI